MCPSEWSTTFLPGILSQANQLESPERHLCCLLLWPADLAHVLLPEWKPSFNYRSPALSLAFLKSLAVITPLSTWWYSVFDDSHFFLSDNVQLWTSDHNISRIKYASDPKGGHKINVPQSSLGHVGAEKEVGWLSSKSYVKKMVNLHAAVTHATVKAVHRGMKG